MGMVTGCYIDRKHEYAGEANKMWWSGVVIKRDVHEGQYDFEFIGYDKIKREYKK
jgi:hypothetical protein